MSNVYRTPLGHAEVHPSGWLPFGAGLDVTAAPLVDTLHPGIFARLTYRDALEVAASLGGRLLTQAEHDELWRIGRKLRPVIKSPGPQMASLLYAQQHDAELTDQLTNWDGKVPLANAGKQWVGGAAAGRALNYGWWDSKAPNGRMWQTLGTRHDDGHVDYSQLTTLVRPAGSGGRVGEGVAQAGATIADAAAEFAAALTTPTAPKSDWPSTVAEQHLARALAELGVSEIPGAKSNPRIDEYLAVAMRGGKPLGLRGDDQFSWCACFYSWCGLPPDMTPCAAVAEMVTQAKATGRWRPADVFHSPKPGDAAIYTRSGGDPRKGGLGHIARVDVPPNAAGVYVTVDGNSDNKVKRNTRRLGDPSLIGWVVYDV